MALDPAADVAGAPGAGADTFEAQFQTLARRVAELRPGDDPGLVRRAWEFSARLHRHQRRRSGEAFIAHPLAVATVLAEMQMDSVCIAAGLLHDAVEDTPATTEQIAREFGPTVAHLVEGVTKMDRIDLVEHDVRQAEYVRKMLLAMVDDIRVILIKLADRLHNMRTLNALPAERQQSIARETMEIYAPLAHRLGMGKMRGELEDLAFSYLEPAAYAELQAAVDSRRAGGQEFLAGVEKRLLATLTEHAVPVRVEGRIKRLYSIWQKLQRQRIDVDQVYDLLAVRIVTDSVRDCYAVLGIVHSAWQPVPGRIKDFIATPRPNMYRSLHTSVIDTTGQPFEVQIRTEEMHRMAEEGIAAHWKYKDGALAPAPDDERIRWLRRLLDWQRETADPHEFLSTFKGDLAPEEVYAFTPKGRIIQLVREACPVDFAYAVHTEIGHRCVGARINGRMVPLRTRLQTGDIVEILTQTGHRPSRDWLGYVRTSRARQKIRHWLNTRERQRATEIGRRALERQAHRFEIETRAWRDSELERVGHELGFQKAAELIAAVGYGKLSARQVLTRLLPEDRRNAEQARRMRPVRSRRPRGAAGPILVRGFSDLMVYRATCCNPVPGEAIVGYITRGKGVAVHSGACPNVEKLFYEPDRKIDVAWAERGREAVPVKIAILSNDNAGMLNAITTVFTEHDVNIREITVGTAEGSARIEVVIEIADATALQKLMQGLKRVAGVRGVERLAATPGADRERISRQDAKNAKKNKS